MKDKKRKKLQWMNLFLNNMNFSIAEKITSLDGLEKKRVHIQEEIIKRNKKNKKKVLASPIVDSYG